ncbi:hypothetical protein E2C01_019985 [Portunus trituberculatus]|uniref:Uncharacterized protein n=1 Tax=Portunus trituberculatus TaxID=210409 RepID=A0A5B7E1X2_PORTR|nr:hypothetical protein [Portunus trituberculatus]
MLLNVTDRSYKQCSHYHNSSYLLYSLPAFSGFPQYTSSDLMTVSLYNLTTGAFWADHRARQ